MINNPNSVVQVVPEEDVIVHSTAAGRKCYPKGEKALMLKAHYAHCADPRQIKPELCEDKQFFLKVPAGQAVTMELEAANTLCLKVCNGCVLLFTGSEESPLVLPESLDGLIEENAPSLLEEGLHNLPLLQEDGTITEVAFMNCSEDDVQMQITQKGC